MISPSATPLNDRTYRIDEQVDVNNTIIAKYDTEKKKVKFSDVVPKHLQTNLESFISATSFKYAIIKTCDLKDQDFTKIKYWL